MSGLWRHGNFRKLWAGQTVSAFGSAIGGLALPLTAVAVLDATPLQMGVLGALATAPVLLFGLAAGVWVDRVRRRPLLIAVELGRALLLASIPIAAALGVLRMEQLYVVSFLAGSLGLLFNLAYTTFLPSVVERAELVEGNSKLAISDSVASIAGPGLAGWLVQLITAPLAIAVDATTFGVSALCLGRVRVEERHTTRRKQASVWRDVREGLAAVFQQPLL